MKILGVLPYAGLKEAVAEVLKNYPEIQADLFVGDMYEGQDILRESQGKHYDFILSRGKTAELMEAETSIPVVYIEISGYDMMRLIKLVQNYTGKKAVVGFSKITDSVKTLANLLRYDVDCYEIQAETDVYPLLSRLHSEGYDFIVGDVITAKTAEIIGLNHALITSGKESIESAVEQIRKLFNQLQTLRVERDFYKQIVENENINIDIFDADGHCFFSNSSPSFVGAIRQNPQFFQYLRQIELKGSLVFNLEIEDQLWQVEGSVFQEDSQKQRYMFYSKKYFGKGMKESGIIKLENDFGKAMTLSQFESSNHLMQKALSAARTHCSDYKRLVIYGEPGTGKDDFALAMHREKGQKNKQFVQVNGRFLNRIEKGEENFFDTLSALIRNKKSKILFFHDLDAIEEPLQLELLEFLKASQSIERLKIVVSTSLPLPKLVEEKKILPELYPLINGVHIFLPPLRERTEDIKNLCSLFITEFNSDYGKEVVGFEDEAYETLRGLHWSYNIKQLREVVKNLVLNAQNVYITADELNSQIENQEEAVPEPDTRRIHLDQPLEAIEQEILEIVLEQENFNQSKAAKKLGISRSTLWRKLKNDS